MEIELVDDRKGCLAVDISANYRIIFEPNHRDTAKNQGAFRTLSKPKNLLLIPFFEGPPCRGLEACCLKRTKKTKISKCEPS